MLSLEATACELQKRKRKIYFNSKCYNSSTTAGIGSTNAMALYWIKLIWKKDGWMELRNGKTVITI